MAGWLFQHHKNSVTLADPVGLGLRFRLNGHNPDTGYSPQFQEQMLRALNEKSSLRGLERAHGVSRHTLSSWLKKRLEDAGTAIGR